MSKEPVDHHYLPKFYLKSFHSSYTKKKKLYRLYSYDKIHHPKIILKTTKEICFEKHRNTLMFEEGNDPFIEKAFSKLETFMAIFFREANNYSKKKIQLKPAWLPSVLFNKNKSRAVSLSPLLNKPYYGRLFNYFISVFYWRLTIHDEYFRLNTTETFISKYIGSLLDKSRNDTELEIIPNFLDSFQAEVHIPFMLGEQSNFMKIYKSFIHPLPNIYAVTSKKYSLCLLILSNLTMVSSDAPFITLSFGIGLDQPFLFTWSPNLVYMNITKRKKVRIKNINEWSFKLSLLNYLQARRFVFCNDKHMLENVVHYANMKYSGNMGSRLHELKEELFTLVE